MAESAGDIFGPLDAETGDESQWTSVTESGTNTFDANTDAADHGTYGFDLGFTGNTNLAYGEISMTPADTMWFRFYIYVPSTLDMNDDYSVLILCNIRDGGTAVVYFSLRSNSLTTPEQWAFAYRFSYTYSSTNFSTDAWHYIEIKYVRDAVNGGCEYYVDGTKVGENLSNDSSTYYPDTFDLGYPIASDTPNNGNYIYFDDIKANSTQIGAYAEAGGIPVIMHHRQQQKVS